jgi:hypothetical protein
VRFSSCNVSMIRNQYEVLCILNDNYDELIQMRHGIDEAFCAIYCRSIS